MDVGSRLGQYEIVARLKAGGMATLFLGRRRGPAGFNRHVAIKVVHPHLAHDGSFVRMFLDEARLSARIHHPNVVHVEELGEAEGTYFLVMEYVHGCSLSQLVRALAKQGRRLSPELAVYIALGVAAGLHAAHEATGEQGELLGVVHRDVSPQNVLLAYKGWVKLIDFGIAKARGRAQQTTSRSLKGKIRYMAPEQAFGEPVDRRTDVYALGIVLWELLTMRRLFHENDDFKLLERVRNPQIDPPSTFWDEVPPELDAVVMKALARKPEDRPESAQELRKMLVEAMPGGASLDPTQLSILLRAMMDAQIEKEREVLPESVSSVMRAETLPADEDHASSPVPSQSVTKPMTGTEKSDEVIRTLTAKFVGPAPDPDADDSDLEAPSTAASPAAVPAVTPTPTAVGTTRQRVPWIIAAAAVAVALVTGGVLIESGAYGTKPETPPTTVDAHPPPAKAAPPPTAPVSSAAPTPTTTTAPAATPHPDAGPGAVAHAEAFGHDAHGSVHGGVSHARSGRAHGGHHGTRHGGRHHGGTRGHDRHAAEQAGSSSTANAGGAHAQGSGGSGGSGGNGGNGGNGATAPDTRAHDVGGVPIVEGSPF